MFLYISHVNHSHLSSYCIQFSSIRVTSKVFLTTTVDASASGGMPPWLCGVKVTYHLTSVVTAIQVFQRP